MHHREQGRCGDSAHKDSVNGFEGAEETPSGGHHDVAVTEGAEVYRRVIEGCIEVAELAAGDQAHRPDRDLGQDRRESDYKDYHHDGHVQQEVPPREAPPDQRRDKSNVCHGRDGLDRESHNEHGDAEEQRVYGRIGKRHDG